MLSIFSKLFIFIHAWALLGIPVLVSASELRFAAVDVGEPYGYKDDNGEEKGILRDILKHLANEISPNSTVSLLPYKRMLYGLDSGEYDCSIFFNSPKGNEKYHQIALVTKKPVVIMSIANTEKARIPAPAKLADFEGKVVGVIRSAYYGKSFDDNKKILKRELDNYQQAINLVRQNRLDALIGPQELIRDAFPESGMPFLLKTNQIWLQCSRHSLRLKEPGVLEAIKNAEQGLHHKDEKKDLITQIHRRYLKNYHRP
ncbi:MAG: transporter substrate-binding domain-containing protein [Bermanella sp.]